jgi:hypothetical protein
MEYIVAFIVSGIFLILSALHFNWAIGGKFGFEGSIPTNEKGERVLNPKRIDSAVVGFGLLLFALYSLNHAEIIDIPFPGLIKNYGGWTIAIIFLLRAIGDFNYVGFFKKKRDTIFDKMDTSFYAPLCLFLSLAAFYLTF